MVQGSDGPCLAKSFSPKKPISPSVFDLPTSFHFHRMQKEINKGKVLPGFEPGLPEDLTCASIMILILSKSGVITATP